MKDFVVSLFLLIFFAPLMLCVAIISMFVFGRDIFYFSERLGLRKRRFTIYKFRSMRQWSEDELSGYFDSHPEMKKKWLENRKMISDPRCSPWGEFMRRFSLDELPQLVNVLRGEMALVGPRPIVDEENRNYGKYSDLIHSVKPGITGLWQVSGRNELSYHRRIAINIYYVRHKSWKLDLWITYKTIWAVIGGRGAW